MQETEAEIRGRLVMLETLVGVTIANVAATTASPETLIRQIMANAEEMLARTADQAPDDEKRAAEYAQAAFSDLGDAMLSHLTAIARPAGRG